MFLLWFSQLSWFYKDRILNDAVNLLQQISNYNLILKVIKRMFSSVDHYSPLYKKGHNFLKMGLQNVLVIMFDNENSINMNTIICCSWLFNQIKYESILFARCKIV